MSGGGKNGEDTREGADALREAMDRQASGDNTGNREDSTSNED